MRTKLLLLFFALGEITASAQTDSLPNITKALNGKLIDPIQMLPALAMRPIFVICL